jgi:uncharacterized protein YcbK (DUF882 family)
VTRAATRAVLAAAAATLIAGPAAADEGEDFVSKKDRVLVEVRPGWADAAARAAWTAALDRSVGRSPAPILNVYNTWHQEFLPVEMGARADAVPKPISDRFLRCHFTQEPTDMDPALFELVVQAGRRFHADRINVISGYRAPKYNLILQKKGHEVSRQSQHTLGKAVDFRIPGVAPERVQSWVRSLRLGGVGIYRDSRFVHADTGRIRTWSGR